MNSVLVTGASTGIGEASALLLAQKGYLVWAGARKASDLEKLKALHSQIRPVELDVTRPHSIQAALDHIRKEGLPLSAVVNNAGIAVAGPLEFLDIEDLRHQFEVNFFAVHNVTRAFLPLLRQARGRIVQISSISGRVAFPFVGPYVASKFALEGYSDSLRRELLPFGIRVVLIEPGRIKTPIWQKSRLENQARRRNLDPQAESLYAAKMNKMDALTFEAEKVSPGPQTVARVVLKSIQSSCPRARYTVGVDSKIEACFDRILPTSWVDFLFNKML